MSIFDILMEMSYKRKRAMELLPPLARRLSEKLVLLHHCDKNSPDIQHWMKTVNGHINEIFSITFLKDGKRLSKSDVYEVIVNEPFGEYDDYLRIYYYIVKEKSETFFSPPSYDDFVKIMSKLQKIVDEINSSKIMSPGYKE